MNTLKFGFVKDRNNSMLKEMFVNNMKLKEIYIDIYKDNPLQSSTTFMLLLRTSENNVEIFNDDNRLILNKDDKHKTQLMNILFSKITDCLFKVSNNCYEFIFNVQNIYYKITILN